MASHLNDAVNDALEIIRTLGSVATAVGLFVGIRQLKFAIRQFKLNQKSIDAQHDRAKKDRAISLLIAFAKYMGARWRAATKLIEVLDDASLRSLYECTPFAVSTEKLSLLLAAIPERSNASESRENLAPNQLTAKEVFALRTEVVSCLNGVECLCHAALTDVADVEIIASELKGLWAPEKNQTFCRAYRDVSGGANHYPMLYRFIATYFDTKTHTIMPIWNKSE